MWVALGRPPRTAGVRYLVKLPQIAQFQRAAQLVFSVSCVVAFGVLFPSPARLTIHCMSFSLQVLPHVPWRFGCRHVLYTFCCFRFVGMKTFTDPLRQGKWNLRSLGARR